MTLQRSALIPVCAFVLAVLAACGGGRSVEQEIISVIKEMEAATEAGNRRGFMNHVSEEFSGQQDSMQQEDLRVFMMLQMNQYNRIYAQLFPIAVTDHGNGRADARFKVLVTGGADLIPDRGELYMISSKWVLEGSNWRLFKASWEPFLN